MRFSFVVECSGVGVHVCCVGKVFLLLLVVLEECVLVEGVLRFEGGGVGSFVGGFAAVWIWRGVARVLRLLWVRLWLLRGNGDGCSWIIGHVRGERHGWRCEGRRYEWWGHVGRS
jgi:hypothetical protein